MHLCLVTTPESLVLRGKSPATGDIWLVIEEQAFPMLGWNDFVVPIVTAFADALLRLLGGAERQVVSFMDGPYAVELARTSPSTLEVRAFQRRARGRSVVKMCGETALRPFVEDVVAQARAIVEVCRTREWSNDAAALESTLARLGAVLGRMTKIDLCDPEE